MLVAIIDLGTNTFNLIVTKIEKGAEFSILFNDKISVKLGEGGINSNVIKAVPYARGIAAIQKHLETAAGYKVEHIYAFATSAIRSASNGNEFVEEIKNKFGVQVQVIDGNTEAELIYAGVRLGVNLTEQNSLIMDIGGGSTEFIVANREKIVWKKSFNLGAARLLEKFSPSDPIKASEIDALEAYFDEQLKELEEALKNYQVVELIGSSGSFDTFAEVITFKTNHPINLKETTSYDFDLTEFYSIHQSILKSTKAERLITPGIIEMRVDMIVISGIFTQYILQKFKIKKMRLSTYALKEGVIFNLMKNQNLN